MEILQLDPPGDAAWDSYVHAHPEGTVFHESAWTAAVMRAYRHRPCLLAAFEGRRIAGVLPLFHVRSALFGSRLVSTAFGIYGGVLADGPDVAAALAGAARVAAGERGARWIEVRGRRAVLAGVPVNTLYSTFRVPIRGGLESTLASLSKPMRQDLRRSANKKWQFASGADVPLERFHRLYLHTLRWHGTPPFPRRWFEALQGSFGARCTLLSIRQGEEWTGASLLLQDRDALMPLYTGVPRANYKLRTGVALHAQMLRMACDRGVGFLDLGRSKRGTGAFDAKSHWGVASEPLGYQSVAMDGRPLPDLTPLNPRYRPLIALWRRLPLWATRLAGPALNASLA